MAISAVTPRVAVAADKAACAAAYEQTQKLRKQGKLRDARAKARVCGESSCPKVVAGDCATWASELDDAIPTITLVVKDADGADVSDVTVTLDGEPLADSLDGKAIAVDPGKHTLWFERSGSAPAESDFLAREGEKKSRDRSHAQARIEQVRRGGEGRPRWRRFDGDRCAEEGRWRCEDRRARERYGR